jgi:hypothetical protein
MMNRLAAMKVAIVTLVLIKCIVAALTPFGIDFINWVLIGRSFQTGNTFPGIYTGPGFILAAVYGVWLAATHNPQVVDQFFQAYWTGPTLGPPSSTIFAFAFVMKTPLLLADALTVYLIMQVVKRSTSSEERALTAGLLWASSPLILLLEMGTTVEIYPALLIMMGSYAIYLSKIKTGSALFALGSALRLAPLLFSWVYVLALARSRKYRALAEFLAVQFAFFGFGATYVVFRYGSNALLQLFAERPGILIGEGLIFLGPFLSSGIGLNPYGLGLGTTFALLVAYIVTKPTVWQNRTLGVEVVGLLGTYFALVGFFIQFFLWIVPTLVVFAVTTKFGSRRFLLVTSLGLLSAFIGAALRWGTANGRAVFGVPNLNGTMLYVSSILTAMVWHPVTVALARSLFSASLVLVVLWVITDSMKPCLRLQRHYLKAMYKRSLTYPADATPEVEVPPVVSVAPSTNFA